MTTKLIGIYGYARTGKDTVGAYLTANHNHTRYAFADPIKRAVYEMFGVTIEDQNNPSLKEKVIPFWGFSPRQMAQLLGTEGGRDLFRQDIWIKRAELEYQKIKQTSRHMVITDVRFRNEIDWIKEENGTLIKITRDNRKSISDHKSNKYFDDSLFDIVIQNNSSKRALFDELENQLLKVAY